ncbi:hypothetical protein HBI25_207520 [Parastagonospora nodorum]|nr:hypothetical protein HBH53_237650 [Parastagonospora nodorum]KAH3956796.1 hypothetical protein HBH51_234770 [Parastagonospora nodorum]KAH4044054.1 hypothetical protein HBH49_224740 [Parastagonospora nodorum]KAH4112301.1 hypothetical protein HBH47_228010 [Parastagonospora nodorum]KAH4157139.1 hypothetical protein HBH43_203330 [Parastagonospora nodorum]
MSSHATKEPTESAPTPRARVTSAAGNLYAPRALPVLVEAFEADPNFTYYLNKVPKASRQKSLEKVLELMLMIGESNNATFYESGAFDPSVGESPEPLFQSAAVVMQPGKAATNFGLRGWIKLIRQGALKLVWRAGLSFFKKILVEYPSNAEQVKKSVFLENEPYYYLLIIGTGTQHRGKGLAAAIIKEHQVIAQKKGLPMYLEASNKGAARVYEKCGFEHVSVAPEKEFVVGKGECDANGERATGNQAVGVRMYPMVWWPQGYVRGKAARV